jgi:hydrogenase nickel incorporation protein HypB
MEIKIAKNVLEGNDYYARLNKDIFKEHKILSLNLMSAPGAGKTTLLESTLKNWRDKDEIGIIEGDLSTSIDEERLKKFTPQVYQINTGRGCHLNAKMVYEALDKFKLNKLKYLFIENVGNLVCPACLTLGEDLRIVLLSLPEGEEKPLKYPIIFNNADAVVINKIDLEPYVASKVEALKANIIRVAPKAKLFILSCTQAQGLESWLDWLAESKTIIKG